jgi:hypothetical protein
MCFLRFTRITSQFERDAKIRIFAEALLGSERALRIWTTFLGCCGRVGGKPGVPGLLPCNRLLLAGGK